MKKQRMEWKRWRFILARRLGLYRQALGVLGCMQSTMDYNTALEEKIAWEQFWDSLLPTEQEVFREFVLEGKYVRGRKQHYLQKVIAKYIKCYGEEE